ncbi:hypothetical protein L6452_02241 [Arctium lappa]|uniref:Uncharacterized protein n=1 Tax=Arctium lappa TaxID=4217 RepID=A0ACB9FKD5_ARCLA|nr:hypothetical protein L6452_02241 [Arctium lappa]
MTLRFLPSTFDREQKQIDTCSVFYIRFFPIDFLDWGLFAVCFSICEPIFRFGTDCSLFPPSLVLLQIAIAGTRSIAPLQIVFRIESGIGWDPVRKTLNATDEWWDEKIKGNKDIAKFRDLNLEIFQLYYEPLFRDSVAVGDRTKAPIDFQNNSGPINVQDEEVNEGKGDSDEVHLDEDDEPLSPFPFPQSSSSKRKKPNNVAPTRSTKGKSAVSSTYEEKLDTVLEALSTRSTQSFPQRNLVPTPQECMDIVKCFPGFEEGSRMYCKALGIFLKEQTRVNFMVPTSDVAKMEFLKMDSDDSYSNDDNQVNYLEEENNWLMLCAVAVKGIIIGHRLNNARKPCRTSSRTGNIFIHEVLNGHPRRCYEDFRVHVPVFKMLCSDLVTRYGLQPTRNICVEESVGIFLMILAHGCGNRLIQETFNHSGETIHRHFHAVLQAVLRLSADIIKPNATYNEDVPVHILTNPRYYPMFKDCIGAIDGTHVRASVREHEQAKYIGRKGYATQNIMAVCDFNMCFTFTWVGWEGTTHDTRIFYEALSRPELKFPLPTGDKYYVVDAGYPTTRGYLGPYKGTYIRYHIPDFRRGQTAAIRAPKGPKETFNYHHSSLRNVIERTFGVWKARWAILKDMHVNYSYETQVNIVIASMAIHNYIRLNGSFDEAFDMAQQESYNPHTGGTNGNDEGSGSNNEMHENESSRRKLDDLYMSAVRDMIAGELMNRSR